MTVQIGVCVCVFAQSLFKQSSVEGGNVSVLTFLIPEFDMVCSYEHDFVTSQLEPVVLQYTMYTGVSRLKVSGVHTLRMDCLVKQERLCGPVVNPFWCVFID